MNFPTPIMFRKMVMMMLSSDRTKYFTLKEIADFFVVPTHYVVTCLDPLIEKGKIEKKVEGIKLIGFRYKAY